ncbi:MAG: hypothetical protein R3E39_20535 [Anaerolineae bacterium]
MSSPITSRATMIHLFLKPILLLAFAFATFSLTARTLGSTQPPNPALEGFTVGCEGKPQPCWYGIVPGETTVNDGVNMLESNSYVLVEQGKVPYGGAGYEFWYKSNTGSPCSASLKHYYGGKPPVAIDTDKVDEIYLFDCPNILSDLIHIFGNPEGLKLGSTRMGGQLMIVMNNGSILVGVSNFSSPSIIENGIFVFASGTFAEYTGNWHGFLSDEEYCQFSDVVFPPCHCHPCLP